MTSYKLLILPVLLIAAGCSSDEKSGSEISSGNKTEETVQQPEEKKEETKVQVDLKKLKIPTPAKYELLDSLCGDLDNDNIPELVIAYNTPTKTDMGNKRSLCIFKLKNDQWELWKESKSALLESQGGGMMGDPYGDMEISKGVLSIFHNGGSSWKWDYVDKYRFQENDFALIGYECTYGKPCEYWQEEDFNLSTGKFSYSKEYEVCEDEETDPETKTPPNEKETFYKKDIDLTLFNRYDKDINFKTPKYKEDIYL